MLFEQFTDRARKVLAEAQAEAFESGYGFIGTECVLIGMLREGTGLAGVILGEFGVSLDQVREKVAPALADVVSRSRVDPTTALAAIGIDLDAVRGAIEASFGEGSLSDPGQSPPFTPRVRTVLEFAAEAAVMLRHRYIGTEHLLLGLLREGEGLACKSLVDLGVDLGGLAAETRRRAAPEQARAQASFERFGDLARQLWEAGPDDPRLAPARELRVKTMTEALRAEQRAVVEAAIRFADSTDAASNEIEAAIKAAGGPPPRIRHWPED